MFILSCMIIKVQGIQYCSSRYTNTYGEMVFNIQSFLQRMRFQRRICKMYLVCNHDSCLQLLICSFFCEIIKYPRLNSRQKSQFYFEIVFTVSSLVDNPVFDKYFLSRDSINIAISRLIYS